MLVLEVAVGVFAALLADRGLEAFAEARVKKAEQRRERDAFMEAAEAARAHAEVLAKQQSHDDMLAAALQNSTVEVTGGRPPKPAHFKKIEERFHELVPDHYLRITKSNRADGKPDVAISSEPFPKAPVKRATTKKAPAKKPVTKKKAAK